MAIFNSYVTNYQRVSKIRKLIPKSEAGDIFGTMELAGICEISNWGLKNYQEKPISPHGFVWWEVLFWWPLIGQVFLVVDGCGLLLGDILYYIVLYYIVLHYITLYIYIYILYFIILHYIYIYVCVSKYSHFQTTWDLIVWGCDGVMIGWWHYVRYFAANGTLMILWWASQAKEILL